MALRAAVTDVAMSDGPPPPGLSLFAVGQGPITKRLVDIEAQTVRSVWSTNPTLSFDPENPAFELEDRSYARKVDLQRITTERALRFSPLLPSFTPQIRVGTAMLRLIISDERLALLEGPDTARGEPVAWAATSGTFLARALELWHVTWAESRPVLADSEEPPLNARQLSVARAMCLGRTDAAIARALDVSPRTVARDVAAVMALTGADSRAGAVLAMLGRGRQSRT
ncbi:hypothetical protein VV01_17880 [Luteipulveratus halotolerans]|uniref:HTH luxR-type domain-containing protein n=1 Tax=Luteipulveratus halotolerans TaxID=1631356 RepID=A0A0L6CLI8_9MICO|nr:hypothetical protein VV01_17880 [Luteipulveratus halotolerans]